MVVEAYGETFPDDLSSRAFPTPAAIARVSPQQFADSVRLGYRTKYVYQLAHRITTRELNLEALRDSDLPTPELKNELLAIKGIGNYAAATLLMLIGRYDELAVDTAFRQFVSKKYFDGERPTDAEAQAIYAEWGEWKYLAYWFDIWQEYTNA
jgi:3-methyladenine DNA glycosylase/8-oxoguanine DNA glycosylase